MSFADSPPVHPRRNPRRALLWITIGLALALWALGVFWGLPRFGMELHIQHPRIYPTAWVMPLVALVAGFGLALPLACLWVNRDNLRAVLRPTWGRVIWGLFLAAFAPVGAVAIFPLALIMAVFALGNPGDIYLFPSVPTFVVLVMTLMIAGVVMTFAFALIYGLPRLWRVPAFVALWIGMAGLVVILGRAFQLVL